MFSGESLEVDNVSITSEVGFRIEMYICDFAHVLIQQQEISFLPLFDSCRVAYHFQDTTKFSLLQGF